MIMGRRVVPKTIFSRSGRSNFLTPDVPMSAGEIGKQVKDVCQKESTMSIDKKDWHINLFGRKKQLFGSPHCRRFM